MLHLLPGTRRCPLLIILLFRAVYSTLCVFRGPYKWKISFVVMYCFCFLFELRSFLKKREKKKGSKCDLDWCKLA